MSQLNPEDKAKIQQCWDFVKDFSGDNVSRTGTSVYVGAGRESLAPTPDDWKPRLYRVKEEFNDYLVCFAYDGVDDGVTETEYKVAKPFTLRGGEESWTVHPPYIPDVSVILAAPVGRSGVVDDEDKPIVLQDLNTDSRDASGFWAEITGNEEDGDNKGRYAWSEQERTITGWQLRENGRAGTLVGGGQNVAYNSVEANNSGGGVQGNSVDIDGPIFTDNEGLSLQFVEGRPVVWMIQGVDPSGNATYSIAYENAIDGECA